jgi:hypothetical protein
VHKLLLLLLPVLMILLGDQALLVQGHKLLLLLWISTKTGPAAAGDVTLEVNLSASLHPRLNNVPSET